jgi:hypothetical protein
LKKFFVALVAIMFVLAVSAFAVPAQAKDTSWGARQSADPVSDSGYKAYSGKEINSLLKRKAWGTDVNHASDDSGYAAMVHVVCTNGTHRYLDRGEGTFSTPSKACGFGGVERIVVGWDQMVYCKNYLPPYQNKTFYLGYYNEVPSAASLKCYMQRPL